MKRENIDWKPLAVTSNKFEALNSQFLKKINKVNTSPATLTEEIMRTGFATVIVYKG